MSGKFKAVLDIGSNTIRLLIAEAGCQHACKTIHYQHKIVRLGEGLQHTGMLGEAGMQRALAAFSHILEVCQKYAIEATDITAVATAAIREASNGTAFVAQVRGELGLHIRIISGEKEAALALTGAKLGLSPDIGSNMCLFDIGGASTEFTRVSQRDLVDAKSLKLGVVRLTELYLRHQPPLLREYDDMKAAVIPFLREIESFWGSSYVLPYFLVGTAGTVTTLSAIAQDLAQYDANKIDGFSMSREVFEALRDRLLAMNNEERLQIPAMEKGREDVIIAGLAVIDALFERWQYKTLISVDSGLLEGLLLEHK